MHTLYYNYNNALTRKLLHITLMHSFPLSLERQQKIYHNTTHNKSQ